MTVKRTLLSSAVWLSACTNALLLLALVVATGCATAYDLVTSDPEITFDSVPPGATVKVTDLEPCKTPCTITIAKPKKQTVTTTLAGFKPKTMILRRRIAYGFWFNIPFGVIGGVGAATDWLTGSMWSHALTYHKIEFDDKDKLSSEEAKAAADEDDEDDATEEQETTPPVDSPAPDAAAQLRLARRNRLTSPPGKRLQEDYPTGYVQEQIRLYYGTLPPGAAEETAERLYDLMLSMQQRGDKADIDEAVRQDQLERLRTPKP